MAQRKTLTEQQVEILRWIADGSPTGVMKDTNYRISAAAMRRRGLVSVSGRGISWKAKITKAGTAYLAQLDGPEPLKPRQANVSVTQELIDEIVAAGGALRKPQRGWFDCDAIDYEQRARIAEQHGKVPAGMWLSIERDGNEVELRLDYAPVAFTEASAELLPVPVPESITRHHPAAARLRSRKPELRVSERSLVRAMRIVHAIATEATRRGWKPRAEAGGVRFDPPGLSVVASIKEHGVHQRGRWEAEVRRHRHYTPLFPQDRRRPVPTGAYDQDATGELEVEIAVAPDGGFDGRQSRWRDRQSWSLEDRLPHMFQEITLRISIAERFAAQQRLAAERAAEQARRARVERERRWRELMAHAREQFILDHRTAALMRQVEAWERAERIRRFCDALDQRQSGSPDAAELLAWAREHLATIDPIQNEPALSQPPEPTPETLQPYLPNGWSANGPEQGGGYYRRW